MNRIFLSKPSWSFGRGVALCLLWGLTTAMSGGPCRLEQPSQPSSQMMVRILLGDCSEEDRTLLAVSAKEVLAALQAGQGVELDGVRLHGDLKLDGLSLEPIPEIDPLPAVVKERFENEQVTEARIIRGPLILRDVDVPGVIATNLVHRGYIIFQEPVSITKSTFHQSVDFSRAIFQKPVDVSDLTIAVEAFFIKAIFFDEALFAKTIFGTHTRFHKAVFVGPADFQGVEFLGLAELLEVTFHQEANFSHTRFTQGSGFSGSRFWKIPNFSEAIFEEGTFFRFSQFDQGANFRESQFHKTADFTDATFGGTSDFSRVVFKEAPQFTEESLKDQFRARTRQQDPRELVGVFVLAGLILLFFYFLFRRHERKQSK